jgi:hypothetical protein
MHPTRIYSKSRTSPPQLPGWFAQRPGIKFYGVKLSDETLPVAAYSPHMLAERINWQRRPGVNFPP